VKQSFILRQRTVQKYLHDRGSFSIESAQNWNLYGTQLIKSILLESIQFNSILVLFQINLLNVTK
jgi:hypothetical protein